MNGEKEVVNVRGATTVIKDHIIDALPTAEQLSQVHLNFKRNVKKISRPIKNIIDDQKTKIITQGAHYATDKLIESEYTKEKANILSMVIIAAIFKLILNTLIFNKIYTGNRFIDLIISIIISIICSMLSPALYQIVELQAPYFAKVTNHIINDIIDPRTRIDYLILWKNRLILTLSAIAIMFLLIVEVSSDYIIDCIISTIVSSIANDQFEQYKMNMDNPKSMQLYEPIDTVTIKGDTIEQPTIIDGYSQQNNTIIDNSINVSINNSIINIKRIESYHMFDMDFS
jgi:hypothetical protein